MIPVYRNAESISELCDALTALSNRLVEELEVVFVVDGSPDDSATRLARRLPEAPFRSQLILLSRNFGSFAAIVAGLEHGRGDAFAVMAADLQEPPELVERFATELASGLYDVVVGTRRARSDPFTTRVLSSTFWFVYRRCVQRDVPAGGVDVFACTKRFRDELLKLRERNSTLVGLVFWLGFRRGQVEYDRLPRRHGTSAWSFSRKLRYLRDSAFAFSDLPVRLLTWAGLLGMVVALVLGTVVFVARVTGSIEVPGYAATALVVMFFGGLNALGIGLLGEYVWRAFENTKQRPGFVVFSAETFDPGGNP